VPPVLLPLPLSLRRGRASRRGSAAPRHGLSTSGPQHGGLSGP
jgi:hypothetical protein